MLEKNGIKYGILPPSNWERLAPIFEAQGAVLPDPSVATAAIAVDKEDDGVIGVLVLQLVYHMEPLWIHPDYRDKVDFRLLQQQLDELGAKGYFVFIPNDRPELEAMARQADMEEVPWKIFKRKG